MTADIKMPCYYTVTHSTVAFKRANARDFNTLKGALNRVMKLLNDFPGRRVELRGYDNLSREVSLAVWN